MESPTRLKDGLYSNYGLGLSAGAFNGRRVVSHSGEVGGFVAHELVLPDDKIAVAVLTNQEASPAAGMIARGVVGAARAAGPSIASPRQRRAKAQA